MTILYKSYLIMRLSFYKNSSLFVAFILLSAFYCAASPLTTLSSKEDLTAYLNKLKFNGVIAATEKGTVLYKEAFGVKDFKSNSPLTIDDRFQIGSNTKQMIAVALLQLQDQKKLSIDDLISKYISTPASYSAITIRDVLNHTSGIPAYNEVDKGKFWQDYNP